jgi:hypothetical protein
MYGDEISLDGLWKARRRTVGVLVGMNAGRRLAVGVR